jgi:FlaA1/EpsC-like NDP-sugar epimerase
MSVFRFIAFYVLRQCPDAKRRSRGSVVIYGAGSAGIQLAKALGSNSEMKVVGFVDDDRSVQSRTIIGIPVFSPAKLADVIASKGVTHVLLALPSVSRSRQNEIIKSLSNSGVLVRKLPSLMDIADGRVTLNDIIDLEVNDLLGRDIVTPDETLLAKTVSNKVVLVTGAGGSIGGELCRQILNLRPVRILLVEVGEYALYTIQTELERCNEAIEEGLRPEIFPLLASCCDEDRMREIIDIWQPDTIYHAAAYKHVPIVEHNIAEGVKNNVLGTLIMSRLAIEKGVSSFVLISTDKAVRPTNVMGASKRLAELCVQSLYSAIDTHYLPKGVETKAHKLIVGNLKTKLCTVRFGNVLDSSGSVIPKFRKQIHDGGPITVTHPDITRYFMTIPEAAELVIQAGALAKGGDVFVLDMGEPIKIVDLARSMIELSGLVLRDQDNPRGDVNIIFTGLRPGEKLFEELLLGDDPLPTVHPKIKRAQDPFIPWGEFEILINRLLSAVDNNNVLEIRSLLNEAVIGYNANQQIVDLAYRSRHGL